MLRGVRFGEVTTGIRPSILTSPTAWPVNTLTGQKETLDQTFGAKIVTDLALSYDVVKGIGVTIGANNVLDVYQDKHTHSGNVSSGTICVFPPRSADGFERPLYVC
jgi:iron complex outermembrane receptor protein